MSPVPFKTNSTAAIASTSLISLFRFRIPASPRRCCARIPLGEFVGQVLYDIHGAVSHI